MNYKVGDKVKIKSREWYNANKDKNGAVYCGDIPFVRSMSEFCGKILTVNRLYYSTDTYEMLEDLEGFDWNDGMIECLVESASNDKNPQPMVENTNPTWEHVNNAFEAGKKWERSTVAGEVRTWLKQNTNWDMEYDEEGRNDNYGKIDELVNAILEGKLL